MKEKLEFLLQNKGLSATSLARLLEIQPSGISHILSGRNKPSFDLVVKILKLFPDINPDWLLLDSDVPYRSSMQPEVSYGVQSSIVAPSADDSLFANTENRQFSETNSEQKNEIEHIFDKYYSCAKKFRKVGTGLGLYLAKEIILAHGGEIDVQSVPYEKTEFKITLKK